MSKGTRIREVLTDEEYSGMLYEDMDEAMLGIYRGTTQEKAEIIIPVYSYIKYIEILVQNGMSEEEATEYMEIITQATNQRDFPLSIPIIIDDTGV